VTAGCNCRLLRVVEIRSACAVEPIASHPVVAAAITVDIRGDHSYILGRVAKHLVDLDEETLAAARAELGTTTIKDTVNEALRRATARRERRVAAALDVLSDARLDDRAEAWR
jgi:Arc/MetJ family transcription regulator